jgi:hypothetical protein
LGKTLKQPEEELVIEATGLDVDEWLVPLDNGLVILEDKLTHGKLNLSIEFEALIRSPNSCGPILVWPDQSHFQMKHWFELLDGKRVKIQIEFCDDARST